MSDTYGWSTIDKTIFTNYISKCKLLSSDDNLFSTFRRDPDYTRVLEGGEYIVGIIYTDRIKWLFNKDLDLIKNKLDTFKENDSIGNPIIYNYEIFGDICPSTVKYIFTALDVKALIGNNKLKKIVEVGGGYGGFCKILSVLYDFDEYILIDLPEVLPLCKKYLDNFPGVRDKIRYLSCEKFGTIQDIDLFISDASMAECDYETQKNYTDKILMNSNYGYIVYNSLNHNYQIDNYTKLLNKIEKKFTIFPLKTEENCIFLRMENK